MSLSPDPPQSRHSSGAAAPQRPLNLFPVDLFADAWPDVRRALNGRKDTALRVRRARTEAVDDADDLLRDIGPTQAQYLRVSATTTPLQRYGLGHSIHAYHCTTAIRYCIAVA